MKYVKESDVDGIVKQGSILILNITLLAINFVHDIICRSPDHISTKKGKSLPSEIWLQIFSWAQYDYTEHVYKPVHPFSIQDSKTGPILFCQTLESWRPCGEIEEGDSVGAYEDYLRHPHEICNNHERPFKLPECQDGAISISINLLKLDKKFLFHEVELADMIAWVEDGACSLCDGGREFSAGCESDREVLQEFIWVWCRAECSIRVPCPLCIGIHYAEISMEEQSSDHGWVEEEEVVTRKEKFNQWVRRRMSQLGYLAYW